MHPETGQWAVRTEHHADYPWICQEGDYTEYLSDVMVANWQDAVILTSGQVRVATNVEVANVLSELVDNARAMGEERTAVFLDGHAEIYRRAGTR